MLGIVSGDEQATAASYFYVTTDESISWIIQNSVTERKDVDGRRVREHARWRNINERPERGFDTAVPVPPPTFPMRK